MSKDKEYLERCYRMLKTLRDEGRLYCKGVDEDIADEFVFELGAYLGVPEPKDDDPNE